MKTENRFLIVILVILTTSVVLTGGLVVYLTLAREREERAPAEAPSAEQPGGIVQSTDIITGESRIAFVSNRESESAIYTMDGDGSNVQQVSTPEMTFCAFPSWSPDGTRLAYVGTTGDPFVDTAEVQVWLSAADGSEHVQVSHAISNVAFTQPSWSPDGTRLAFQSRSEPEGGGDPTGVIHIVRASDGESERNLAFPSEIQHLAWSPVEDRLVVVSGDPGAGTIVHVMSSDGSEITQVFRRSMMADWTPDGGAIVVGDYMSEEILVVDISSQTPAPRTVGTLSLQPLALAMSPDGARVAATTAGHYQQDYATALDVVTVETGEVATIAEGSGWMAWPHWSSDGQSLLFTWGLLGRTPGLPRAALWVYDTESGELLQLTSDESFNGLGVWSP